MKQPLNNWRQKKLNTDKFIICSQQIPRDILLEILGPSKVYKHVIKKVINSTIAAYVEKVKI